MSPLPSNGLGQRPRQSPSSSRPRPSPIWASSFPPRHRRRVLLQSCGSMYTQVADVLCLSDLRSEDRSFEDHHSLRRSADRAIADLTEALRLKDEALKHRDSLQSEMSIADHFSKLMPQPYTRSQLSDKLRRLCKKFRIMSGRIARGQDPSHLAPHARASRASCLCELLVSRNA